MDDLVLYLTHEVVLPQVKEVALRGVNLNGGFWYVSGIEGYTVAGQMKFDENFFIRERKYPKDCTEQIKQLLAKKDGITISYSLILENGESFIKNVRIACPKVI